MPQVSVWYWVNTPTSFQHYANVCLVLPQDLLGFRLDEAVEKEKGSSSGLVSLSRRSSLTSGQAQQGTVYND